MMESSYLSGLDYPCNDPEKLVVEGENQLLFYIEFQ